MYLIVHWKMNMQSNGQWGKDTFIWFKTINNISKYYFEPYDEFHWTGLYVDYIYYGF